MAKKTKPKTRKAETTKPSPKKAKPKATESVASRTPAASSSGPAAPSRPSSAQQAATAVAAESMPTAEKQEAPATPETTSRTPTTSASPDTRLPAKGTVLQKRDRQGTVRCECAIVEGGVQYRETVYRSLSAAAVAAAKDLGLAAKALNGFTFWGLTRPARKETDPIAVLEKAWTRYWSHLVSTLEQVKEGEHREPVLTTIQRHARVLQNRHDEVA